MSKDSTDELRKDIKRIVEYWDFSPLQDEDSRIERIEKELLDAAEAHYARQGAQMEKAVLEQDQKAHMIGFKNGKWAIQKRMNDLWCQLMIDEVGSEKAFAYRDAIEAEVTADKESK